MMKRNNTSFCAPIPITDNIYTLVVVASLRARQLNKFNALRQDAEKSTKIVDQALDEVFSGEVEYFTAELEPTSPGEEDGSEE